MKHHQLISIWNAVTQWLAQTLLSPAVRRYMLCVAMLAVVFVLCLAGGAALHHVGLPTQVVSALHQMNKLPYSIPWP